MFLKYMYYALFLKVPKNYLIEICFITTTMVLKQDWRIPDYSCSMTEIQFFIFPVGCKILASRVTWPCWVTAWQLTSLCWTESDCGGWLLVSSLIPHCGFAGCSGTSQYNNPEQTDICGYHCRNKVMRTFGSVNLKFQ